MSRKITIIFEGGTRGNPGAGFGNYAIIRDNQRTVTRLEFGYDMTNHEAAYDTLITALEELVREPGIGDAILDINSSNPLVISQVKGNWKAQDARMHSRCEHVRDLLRHFKASTLNRISPEQAASLLNH